MLLVAGITSLAQKKVPTYKHRVGKYNEKVKDVVYGKWIPGGYTFTYYDGQILSSNKKCPTYTIYRDIVDDSNPEADVMVVYCIDATGRRCTIGLKIDKKNKSQSNVAISYGHTVVMYAVDVDQYTKINQVRY